MRGLKLITYLFLGLSLSSCSMLGKVIENAGIALQGAGGAGLGCAIGQITLPTGGCAAGAMLGGAAGSVIADKTINQEPPTWKDVLIMAIEVLGWVLLLPLMITFLSGWLIPSHREVRMMKNTRQKQENVV